MNIEQMKELADEIIQVLETVYKYKNQMSYSAENIDCLITDYSAINHIDFILNDLLQFVDYDIKEREKAENENKQFNVYK